LVKSGGKGTLGRFWNSLFGEDDIVLKFWRLFKPQLQQKDGISILQVKSIFAIDAKVVTFLD
jgi:hypothetical protein